MVGDGEHKNEPIKDENVTMDGENVTTEATSELQGGMARGHKGR